MKLVCLMFKKLFQQSSEERFKMITEGNLLSMFLFLSIPGIMIVIIQAVMPVIEGLLIYNYDNNVSGAAISYISSMQNIFIIGAQGLVTAGSALVGQTNGSGHKKEAVHLSGQLMSTAFLTGVALIPVTIVVGILMANMLDGEIRHKVILYNTIFSLSIPLVVCYASFSSIKNVFGHPESTFIRTLLFVPIKLCFTYLFVAIMRLGVVGAAMSAICAYFTISLFIFYDLIIKNSEEKLSLPDLKINFQFVKKIFRFSWASVLQNSTKSLGFFLIKLQTMPYGNVALSAQGIASDVTNMFQNFTACYDAAIISSVSINIGAGNPERAKKTAQLAIKIGVISSVVLSALCSLSAPLLISFYTKDLEIATMAKNATYITSIGFIGFSILFNEMPAYIGLGLNKVSLFIQTMRIWVIRLVCLYAIYFFVKDIGVYAIFISMTLCNIFGAIISHIFFRRVQWKKFSLGK